MQASGASMSDKLWQWVPLSILCAAVGLLLHFVPVHDPRPFGGCRGLVCLNKNLWSLSCKCSSSVSGCPFAQSGCCADTLLTAGMAGGLFSFLHLTLDSPRRQAPTEIPGDRRTTWHAENASPSLFSIAVAPLRWMGWGPHGRLQTARGLLGCVVSPMRRCVVQGQRHLLLRRARDVPPNSDLGLQRAAGSEPFRGPRATLCPCATHTAHLLSHARCG